MVLQIENLNIELNNDEDIDTIFQENEIFKIDMLTIKSRNSSMIVSLINRIIFEKINVCEISIILAEEITDELRKSIIAFNEYRDERLRKQILKAFNEKDELYFTECLIKSYTGEHVHIYNECNIVLNKELKQKKKN